MQDRPKYSSNPRKEIQKCKKVKDAVRYVQFLDPCLKNNGTFGKRVKTWYTKRYPTDQRSWFDQLQGLANDEDNTGDTGFEKCWQKCVTEKIKSINISNQREYSANPREEIQKCKSKEDVVFYAQSQDLFLKNNHTLDQRLINWFKKHYPTDQRCWFDQLQDLANDEDNTGDTGFEKCWQKCVTEKIKSTNISNQCIYISNLRKEIQKCKKAKDVLLYAQSQDPLLKDNDTLGKRLRQWFKDNYPTDQRCWFDQLQDLANDEDDTQLQLCWQKCVTEKIKSINISNQREYSANSREEIQKCERQKDVILYAQFLDPLLKDNDTLGKRLKKWFNKKYPQDERSWFKQLKDLANDEDNTGDTGFEKCWQKCVLKQIKSISNQNKKNSSEVDGISREENISTVYNTQDSNILNSKNISEQYFDQEESDPFCFQQYGNQYNGNNGINENNYHQYYINNVYNLNVFDNEGLRNYQVNGNEINNHENDESQYTILNTIPHLNYTDENYKNEEAENYFYSIENNYQNSKDQDHYGDNYDFLLFDGFGNNSMKTTGHPVQNCYTISEERENYRDDGNKIQEFISGSYNSGKKRKTNLVDKEILFSKKRRKNNNNDQEKIDDQDQYMFDSDLSGFDNKQQNNQNQENIEIDSYNNRQNYFNVIDSSSNNEKRKSVYESRVPLFNTSSFSPNQDNLIEENNNIFESVFNNFYGKNK